MTAGIIAYSSIPGWPSPPDGLALAVEAAGITFAWAPDGVHVSDLTAAQTLISAYVGSATQLSHEKALQQAALDDFLNKNFDLLLFIRAGTSTALTGANVGTFLATIANNYRTLRANIAAATTVAQVQAINVNQGWPSNP